MIAKEQEKAIDVQELANNVQNAVAEVVKHQVDVGIDIISDGEMSKIGFANYVKDRLTGFGGESNPVVAQDVLDHPDMRVRMFRRNEGGESGPPRHLDTSSLLEFLTPPTGYVVDRALCSSYSGQCAVLVVKRWEE